MFPSNRKWMLKTVVALVLLFTVVLLVPPKARGIPVKIVYLVEVEMTIDAGASDIVSRGIDLANEDSDAELIVIRLNTDGGYLDSTEDIVYSILDSDVDVTVYIGPSGARAFSAGTYIALASKEIAMAGGTVIGAATPIPSDTKVVNAMANWMRTLAELHGRNATAAESLVRDGIALTASDAKRFRIAETIVSDFHDLLLKHDLQDAELKVVSPNLRSQMLSVLNNPTIVWLFFIVGFILVLLGLFHPTFVGEATGIVCIILALFGLDIIGVNPLIFALLVIGASTIFLELKKGHGALAVTGVLISLLAVALVYQGKPFIRPEVSDYVITILGIAFAGFIGFYIHKIRGVLKIREAAHNLENLVGQIGDVRTAIDPPQAGVIFLASDLWTAIADEAIGAGEKVKVVGVEGVKLKVEKIEI